MKTVSLERLGGLAGYGAPGSALQARGEVATASLSDSDRATIENLFKAKGRSKSLHPPIADGFTYRLVREVNGRIQTIEVPEDAVPIAMLAAVKDEFVTESKK